MRKHTTQYSELRSKRVTKDWACLVCAYANQADTTRCQRCGMRPVELVTTVQERPASTKPGEVQAAPGMLAPRRAPPPRYSPLLAVKDSQDAAKLFLTAVGFGQYVTTCERNGFSLRDLSGMNIASLGLNLEMGSKKEAVALHEECVKLRHCLRPHNVRHRTSGREAPPHWCTIHHAPSHARTTATIASVAGERAVVAAAVPGTRRAT